MMADSVEAASRSLKVVDEKSISTLVDKIIDKQVESGQFQIPILPSAILPKYEKFSNVS